MRLDEYIRSYGEAAALAFFERRYPQSYDAFLQRVQEGIDFAVQSIEKNAREYFDSDEDHITTAIVENLIAQGLNAAHDADYSGHLDVSIESQCRKFFWGAEAKIDRSLEWIHQGVKQLFGSYLDGMPNRDHAGLLIYVKKKNCSKAIASWKTSFLAAHKDDEDFSVRNCTHRHPYAFVTVQQLERTGQPVTLRHIGVSVWRERSVDLEKERAEKAERKAAAVAKPGATPRK